MKKVLNYIVAITGFLFLATSCTDILDQEPVNSAKLENVFSDIGLAKAFLGNCYDKMGGDGGVLGMREDLLCSNTDQTFCIHRPNDFKFVKGNALAADALGHIGGDRFGFLNWGRLYANIQRVNTFLANVDKVPTEANPADTALISQMKGEAYFIRAYDYSQLLFTYGGVVLADEPFVLGGDYKSLIRSTLQQTEDFILADVANAFKYLPVKNPEQGRATRAAAAALKSRLLLFCASDLVNGGLTTQATNTLVSFTTGTQTQRWTQARDAAKAIMDGTYGAFSLVGVTTDPPSPLTANDIKNYGDNYANLFIQKSGAWNSESLWGIQYNITGGNTQRINIWNGPNGYHNWGNNDPTEPAVRKFEMADGTPFVWDSYGQGQDLRTATAAELAVDPLRSPYNGREPRFYATVLYHGASWQQRPTDAAGLDPLNIVQTGHFYNNDGTVRKYGLDSRNGEIENWNGTKNGYYLKKFMDPLSQGQFFNNTNAWIEYRYAEVLLNYAEACIELGVADLQNGLDALNMVRNRAGLPDRVTADQVTALDYLHHERYIEFFAEGQQWYDMRRWITAASLIENVYEMKIKQFDNGNMEWKLDRGARADQRSFVEKNYWTPIPRDELKKGEGLIQNPGF